MKLVRPSKINNFLNIRSVVETTYYLKVYRCSKSMRSWMHCEYWIPVHCDATTQCEGSWKVRNSGYL